MGKVDLFPVLGRRETDGHFNEVAPKTLRNVFEGLGKCCGKV